MYSIDPYHTIITISNIYIYTHDHIIFARIVCVKVSASCDKS